LANKRDRVVGIVGGVQAFAKGRRGVQPGRK